MPSFLHFIAVCNGFHFCKLLFWVLTLIDCFDIPVLFAVPLSLLLYSMAILVIRP